MRTIYIMGMFGAATIVGLAQGRQQPQQGSATPSAAATPLATNPHYAITDEDKARKNPVDFTELTVERGRKLFESQCAMCHGEKADGTGEVAQDMKLTLPDFTKTGDAERKDGR